MEFNLAQVFTTVAGVVPDREAIVWRDRRLTYRQLDERRNRLANYLLGRGLGTVVDRGRLHPWESGQQQIGIYLRNGNEYLEAMLGAFTARLAPLNVNYRYVDEELAYLLDDASVSALVYGAEFAPTLAKVRDRLPVGVVLVQVADGSGNPLLDGAADYEEALAASSPGPPPVEPSPDDLYILYTGGTTGMPKGVLWRQHDIYMAAMGGRPYSGGKPHASYEDVARAAEAGPGARTLVLAPCMHGASQWSAFIMFSTGGTLVFPSVVTRIDPADVWRTVEAERVASIPMVGDAMARPLLEELTRNAYDTSSIRAMSNGGAPLNPALKDRILAAVPGVVVVDSVGASETGYQANHGSTQGAKASTGTFTADAATVVVDETMSRLLDPGHEGMGWLARRGNVPLGYLGDPEKSARTFPVIEGERHSVPGDRARLLADGQLELLGRDSMTINSGGEKIFVEEVERALAQHPDVADVMVVGRPSERWGNEVVALVAARAGAELGSDELEREATRHIARYKLPKAYVFLPELVRSPAGKADYRWARRQAEAAAAEPAGAGTAGA